LVDSEREAPWWTQRAVELAIATTVVDLMPFVFRRKRVAPFALLRAGAAPIFGATQADRWTLSTRPGWSDMSLVAVPRANSRC
jgi:hypothetical protein